MRRLLTKSHYSNVSTTTRSEGHDHRKLPAPGRRKTVRAAFDQPPIRCVRVASNYQLARQSHVHRLAIATVERRIPRRKLADWIAEVLANYDGKIVWASGIEFTFDELAIDDAFEIDKDPSQRWVGGFYRFAVRPPKQVAQERVIARLRFIDLAFRIAYPERAALIAQ